MRSHTRPSFVAALAAGTLAASALVAAAGPPASAASGPTTHVWVTASHKLVMPSTLRPGVHRFHVYSAQPAALQLVRPRPGYSKKQACADINAALGQNDLNALKRFERHLVLLGGANSKPGSPALMWARVPAGTTWALDTSGPCQAANLRTVRVQGTPVAGTAYAASRLAAIGSTSFAPAPRSIPHAGVLRFRNHSEDNHFLELDKLKPGKTVADFRRFINAIKSGKNPGPPPVTHVSFSTGVVSPGHAFAVRYAMPRGHYIMVCWWSDSDMGGMPHAFMGMFREIRLR